jgi:HK97 family phage portal protein
MSRRSLLSRVVGARASSLGTLANPTDAMFEALGAARTFSGTRVSPEGALSLIPLYSGASLLANAIGSLPIVVYRRDGDGKVVHRAHRTHRILTGQPTPGMGADEVFAIVGLSLVLWGNAYLAKGYGADGLVNELVPLHPKRVGVGRKNGRAIFTVDGKGRSDGEPFGVRDILHIRGLSSDGVVGYSPVQLARQALGTGMALEEFAGRFWDNNARPGVILKHPSKLTEEAAKRLKATWDAAHGGLANIAKTAVLEEGMDVEAIGMPLQDAQLVEQMRLTDIRVAQLLHIPPALMLANPGTSLTYSTTEGQGIDFVRWSLRPWLVRIAGALLADPDLFAEGGDRIFPEHDVSAMLKADLRTRAEVARGLVNDGIATPDEGRGMVDLNPLGGAAAKLRPKAAPAPAKVEGPQPTPPAPAGEGDTPTEGEGA